MIEFKKIKWKNFLSTGNQFTEIDLSKNQLTLMVGKNGAGKSTLLDALSFVLFGKPFRNINKNQLINTINKKNTEVHIDFNIGKKQYNIVRGIKPNTFEIRCNDQLIDQNAEQKEYQEMLEKQILKINNKSFNQVVILGSASFVPFMQLTAANRREIIEDLLDIEIFSKMNVLLKDKISANKEGIQETDYAIKHAQSLIAVEEKHVNEKRQNTKELIGLKSKQKQKIQKQIQHNSTEKEKLVELISALTLEKEQHEKKQAKIYKLEKYKDQLLDKISNFDNDISFFHDNDNCPTCKQSIDENFKHTTIDQREKSKQKYVEGVEEIDQQIKDFGDVDKLIGDLDRQINDIDKQKQKLINTIYVDEQLIENIDIDISSLNEEDKKVDLQEIEKQKQLLQDNQELHKKLLEDKQTLDVASLLLKDTGIKTKIIKQYIPVMNKLINKYLAAMDFFVNFELDENFEEKIKSRFRDEFKYESFSEGEKMRIDLALLFTWRSIAKLRNSISTNLLIMDEVFDSSLDTEGTDEFMKILQQLTKENNTFIISHKGDQLFDKFENVVKFEKVKNFSRISK